MSRVLTNRDTDTGSYLLDCWYVGAWTSELERGGHIQRTLLDRSVMLARSNDGAVAAIGNICPHRFASLSDGRFEDGVVECPYHGLRFDLRGECVHNPHGDGRIAERARVPCYPVVERYGALWIWFGDTEAADPALVPDLTFLDTPSPEERASGYLHIKANYQLLSDNLLDLSHADFLHRDTLGTECEMAASRPKVQLSGATIDIEWSFQGQGAVIQRPHWNGGRVDMRIGTTWHPAAVMILRTDVVLLGDPTNQKGNVMAHIMTPETRKSTHYFFESGESDRRRGLALGLQVFAAEDGVMLEEVQRNMGDSSFWDLDPLVLSNDKGAIMARRVLQRLMQNQTDAWAG